MRQVFFFYGRSAVLRPSVHMLPGTGWCGAGLPPFTTACWWLTHPVAITSVFGLDISGILIFLLSSVSDLSEKIILFRRESLLYHACEVFSNCQLSR